jgi:glycosyltransferase involved in cell wall biosynthesis
MVAAESAAAGCPPVVADHSGLAEVGQGLEADYPPALRALVRFPSGDAEALRTRLSGIFALAPADRAALREAARRAAAQRWSWGSVAERILDAALRS